MDTLKLIQIAKELNLTQKVQELIFLANRLSDSNKNLILPLIGEFSSGKTSLINSLLDNPNLETASQATTASIFEIRFGAEDCHAEIISNEGINSIDDVSNIKNKDLSHIDIVKVYDTSNRIGSSTILVDTPGLSSNDPNHRIALSSYLPNADAFLLLTDINQQLTKSILEFVNESKLIDKPIYLIITKCDTKTEKEINEVKEYIKKNIDFKFNDIITISALKDNMSEFDALISKIQTDKNTIVENSIKNRIKTIASEMALIVSDLLKLKKDTEIDKIIEEENNKLNRINRNINNLIESIEQTIDSNTTKIVSNFSTSAFNKLDTIVKEQGRDCDNDVYSAVNCLGTLLSEQFQKDVLFDITNLARMRQGNIDEVPMSGLETMNFVNFSGFSYNLNLSSIGHKYDKAIGYGVLIAASAAAVVAAPAVAGAAGATGAATTGSMIATGTGTTIAADIATDAYVLHRIEKRMKQYQKFKENVNQKIGEIDKQNQELGQRIGANRGAIETCVSWITDFTAKPQRQKAIHNYINDTLIPEFRMNINHIATLIKQHVISILREEAISNSQNIKEHLESLKRTQQENQEEYMRKIEQYKNFQTFLTQI